MAFWAWRPLFSPMMGFIGANGAGKSAMAVTTVLDQARRSGAPVYSNIDLHADGVDVREVQSLRDVLNIEHAHVLWDEISSVAPARATQDNAPELVLRLSQLRHFDATLVWTSPVLEDVDVLIRRVTQDVVEMRPLWRVSDPDGLWPRTVLAAGRHYDFRPVDMVSITTETNKRSTGFVRLSTLALDSYDTRQHIDLRADHAVCLVCGLRKRREFCKGNHPAPTPSSMPEGASLDHGSVSEAPGCAGTARSAATPEVAPTRVPHNNAVGLPVRDAAEPVLNVTNAAATVGGNRRELDPTARSAPAETAPHPHDNHAQATGNGTPAPSSATAPADGTPSPGEDVHVT